MTCSTHFAKPKRRRQQRRGNSRSSVRISLMATTPAGTPAPPSPIAIGDCEVTIESKKFALESDPNCLSISVSRKAQIKIAVKGDGSRASDDGNRLAECKGKELVFSGDEYYFVLVNPKDADSRCKSLIQEVLKLYSKELPAMNYAANTGKESMFLERCVANGKYRTLILKRKSLDGLEEVLAAITYQIVPADTNYAEIPLAAVSAIYQHKGIGRLLFTELRNRLQSVGICAIFCWGDKESEEFWFKMGFVSVAEVDSKGRARRLPIKADIRKALCFPGGSTLMVSHLSKDISVDPSDSLKLSIRQSKMFSSFACVKIQGLGPSGENCATLAMTSRTENCQPEELLMDGITREAEKVEGTSQNHGSGKDKVPSNKMDYQNKEYSAKLSDCGAHDNVDRCHCSGHGKKRIVWEATLSSLKSKKVKGSQQADCQLCCDGNPVLESERNDSHSEGCLSGFPRNNFLGEAIPSNREEKNAKKWTSLDTASTAPPQNEVHSGEACFRIMLMDIAEDTKKAHLTKVIEGLGGVVASDGSTSTHIVTGKVRRTLNFCTALCSGAWILSPLWLKQSFREGRFVDELPYILDDKDYSLKYRSELKGAVLRGKARPRALLEGYNVCISAHVQPPIKTMTAIVIAAGGTIIRRLDKVNDPSKTIFIACEEDMEEALVAAKKGAWTFSSDWFMNCIMRQQLDLEEPQFAESL
ncbi:uncharacterized protein LOC104444532 isoform X2 [Eucalyptus grandis]|uniref:uncharacterized protein LOC104444532 isoform X2 n=1 Tax=Eucalyptus grandis TaxID=71139 RepID=UPI0008A0F5B1|nr:uncharacterized protein LOC104444532 isoform X2 [Eucalyptus grandis]